MFLPTFLSLSVLALLQLGATQEFVILTRNQLREEIQAGITAALSSTNQSPSPLNLLGNNSCTCDRLNDTLQEAVGRLQQQINVSAADTSATLQEATGKLQQQINATLQEVVGRLQQQILLHAFCKKSAPYVTLVEVLLTPQSPAGI